MEHPTGLAVWPGSQTRSATGALNTEREQALVRILYLVLGTGYVALAAARGWDPGAAFTVSGLGGFLAYSVGWLLFVQWRPEVRWRPLTALVLDTWAVSFAVAHMGALGVVFVPLYASIAAGNGVRYGVPYLYLALIFGVIGFVVAAATNPFWMAHRPVELGLGASIGGVPPLLAIVLARLRRSHEELSRLYQEMERMARHDALTGLLNAKLLQEGLGRHLAVAARYHRPLAVLFIDLDNFKAVNDTLGHAAGDALLRQVAERLRRCVRCSDLAARAGGDEFVLVLTEMQTAENALFVAEKLVGLLSGEQFALGAARPVTMTTSVGVAIYPEAGTTAETLLEHADIAMYRAKRQGRNRWCRFSDEIDRQPESCLVGASGA